MNTSKRNDAGFAVWLTGLPASGKTTIARALAARLERASLRIELLDSDEMRRELTPNPTYDERERDLFYRAVTCVARRLADHGAAVLIAATANKRAYRDHARATIGRFIEVFVDCPIEVCKARDPKGLYRRASTGELATLPGVQDAYEPPIEPEIVVHSDRASADEATDVILRELRRRAIVHDK